MVQSAVAHKTATIADSTAAPLPAATAIPWRAAVQAASAERHRHGPTICRAVAARTVDNKASARAAVIAVATVVVHAAMAAAAVSAAVRADIAAAALVEAADSTVAVAASAAVEAVVSMAVEAAATTN